MQSNLVPSPFSQIEWYALCSCAASMGEPTDEVSPVILSALSLVAINALRRVGGENYTDTLMGGDDKDGSQILRDILLEAAALVGSQNKDDKHAD